MKNILIIGASSSTGQLLTYYLGDLYNLYGTFNNTKPPIYQFKELIKINFLDKKQVLKIKSYLIKVTDIVFCIGNPGINASNHDYVHVNITPLYNLITLCQEIKHHPRIIFLSSSSVYSSIKSSEISEKTTKKPSNHYGYAKLQAENLLINSNLPYVILRFPIVYGEYFFSKFSELFFYLQNNNAKIFGMGDNLVPYICEEDLANGIQKIIASPKTQNTSFILSSGSIKQRDYWNTIAKIMGAPSPTNIELNEVIKLARKSSNENSESWWYKRDIESFTRNRVFDCNKAKKELGWVPVGDFRKCFRTMFLSSNGKTETLLKQKKIATHLKGIFIKYKESINHGFRLGVPQPKPFGKFLNYITLFSKIQVNNIGTATRMDVSHESTRGLEKEVISWLGNIYGDNNVDGYICTGSTEGNLQALWIAKESLLKHGTPTVITHYCSHYSIKKASRILNINIITSSSEKWNKPFDGEVMRELLSKCSGPVIYVATVGQTSTGIIDDIDSVEKVLKESKRNYFIHVDAAIGGFVLPFINKNKGRFFKSKSVMTITTDFHKFGLGPYPSGAFICRKNLQNYISVSVDYTGMIDDTISGSRPGSISALLWANINYLGERGFKINVQKSLELKSFFLNEIKLMGIKYIDIKNMTLLNILFSERLPEKIETKYHLFPVKRRYEGKDVFSYAIYFSHNAPKKTYIEFLTRLSKLESDSKTVKL